MSDLISRQAAIDALGDMPEGDDDFDTGCRQQWNWDTEAIKALEKGPCEDAISRQALIERINNAEENFKIDYMDSISSDVEDPFVDGVLSGVFNIRQMIAQAPSVTPTRKKGNVND